MASAYHFSPAKFFNGVNELLFSCYPQVKATYHSDYFIDAGYLPRLFRDIHDTSLTTSSQEVARGIMCLTHNDSISILLPTKNEPFVFSRFLLLVMPVKQ